jgi:hypothetical protein
LIFAASRILSLHYDFIYLAWLFSLLCHADTVSLMLGQFDAAAFLPTAFSSGLRRRLAGRRVDYQSSNVAHNPMQTPR